MPHHFQRVCRLIMMTPSNARAAWQGKVVKDMRYAVCSPKGRQACGPMTARAAREP